MVTSCKQYLHCCIFFPCCLHITNVCFKIFFLMFFFSCGLASWRNYWKTLTNTWSWCSVHKNCKLLIVTLFKYNSRTLLSFVLHFQCEEYQNVSSKYQNSMTLKGSITILYQWWMRAAHSFEIWPKLCSLFLFSQSWVDSLPTSLSSLSGFISKRRMQLMPRFSRWSKTLFASLMSSQKLSALISTYR